MKKNTIMLICWAVILLIIVGILTYLGINIKKTTKYYEDLERKIVNACEKYVLDNNIILEDDEVIKIKSRDLIENGYMKEIRYKEDACVGYVEITNDGVYNYKGYIKCNNYKTRNYKN